MRGNGGKSENEEMNPLARLVEGGLARSMVLAS